MKKSLVVAFISIVILAGATSCASIYRSYRDRLSTRFQEAQDAYNRNELIEALEGFEDIKAIDPDYRNATYRVEEIKNRLAYLRESYYAAGVAQERSGQALNAVLSFQTCLAFSPGHDHKDARKRVGKLLDHPQVQATLKRYLDSARAFRTAKNYAAARQQYGLALRVDPGLGEARSGLHDIDDQLRSDAEPVNAEGEKLLKRGNYAAAVLKFQQALAIFPQFKEAAQNLERSSVLARNEQSYQTALAAANGGNPTGCLGALSRIQGYHAPAIALQSRCREEVLKNVDTYFQQAVALYQQQKLQEALALFRWILSVRPDHEEAARYAEILEKKLATLRSMEGQ